MIIGRRLCALAAWSIASAASATPVIVVDQFGYLPDQPKVAVLREPVVGFDAGLHYARAARIELVDLATGKTVLTGAPAVWNKGEVDPSSGDRAWWFDFSTVVRPGRYQVVDPANHVRSPPFSIGDGVYRPVLVQAVRMLFYQRAGFPKEARYAGAKWADGASHQGPLQDRHARLYSAPGDASTERDLHGGWFDAGDFNRYTSWAAQNVVELLNAYRERPGIWTDDYNIPKSGDGIPDLLNEVDWELDWLERMQLPDGSLLFETASDTGSPPSSAKGQSLYGPPNSHATSAGAAAFAVAALVDRTVPAWRGRSAVLTERAERAWGWVSAHPRVTFTDASADNGKVRMAGDAIETDDAGRAATMVAAAVYLFELTGKPLYRDYVDAHLSDAGDGPNFATEALVHYAGLKGATPSSVAAFKRALFEHLVRSSLHRRSPRTTPIALSSRGYWWGSNRLKAETGLLFVGLATLDAGDRLHSYRDGGRLHPLHPRREPAGEGVSLQHGRVRRDRLRWTPSSTAGSPKARAGKASAARRPVRRPAISSAAPTRPTAGSRAARRSIRNAAPAMPSPPAGQPPQKSYKDFATALAARQLAGDRARPALPDCLYPPVVQVRAVAASSRRPRAACATSPRPRKRGG